MRKRMRRIRIIVMLQLLVGQSRGPLLLLSPAVHWLRLDLVRLVRLQCRVRHGRHGRLTRRDADGHLRTALAGQDRGLLLLLMKMMRLLLLLLLQEEMLTVLLRRDDCVVDIGEVGPGGRGRCSVETGRRRADRVAESRRHRAASADLSCGVRV